MGKLSDFVSDFGYILDDLTRFLDFFHEIR